MDYITEDFYEYIMAEAEADALLEELREQAQHDWELEQD